MVIFDTVEADLNNYVTKLGLDQMNDSLCEKKMDAILNDSVLELSSKLWQCVKTLRGNDSKQALKLMRQLDKIVIDAAPVLIELDNSDV